MENTAYPILKEPENLPKMQPKVIYQPAAHVTPRVEEGELAIKINWAQIFNIIILIGVILIGLAYDPSLSEVTNAPYFRYFLFFKYVLIVVNLVFYFMQKNETVRRILKTLSYASFVELVLSILILVIVIEADLAYIIAAAVGLIFIALPTFLVGLTSWILLKNSRSFQTGNDYYMLAQKYLQQENVTEPKKEENVKKLIPVQYVLQP